MFLRAHTDHLPWRLPSFRNSAAPTLFFIDVMDNKGKNPVLPVPMRIDKVSNGEPTLFFLPKKIIYKKKEGKVFYIDPQELLHNGIRSLLEYAKTKFYELTLTPLKEKNIFRWWNQSSIRVGAIPSFNEDIATFLEYYLDAYLMFLDEGNLKDALLDYTEKMITYLNKRLSENTITLQYKGEVIKKEIYKEKNGRIKPHIWEFDVDIIGDKKQKRRRRAFIPYLIYDDLLECFLYNEKVLNEDEMTQQLYSFQEIFDLGIIKVIDEHEFKEPGDNNNFQNFLKLFESININSTI